MKYAGLTGTPEDLVEIDENFKRPAEVDLLVGDSSKALIKLGWKPRMNFNQLVKKMVDNDLL
jgi:GDPmannose 4,6-dehydratase